MDRAYFDGAFGHSMRAGYWADRLLDPINCAYECFGLLSLKLAVTAEQVAGPKSREDQTHVPPDDAQWDAPVKGRRWFGIASRDHGNHLRVPAERVANPRPALRAYTTGEGCWS